MRTAPTAWTIAACACVVVVSAQAARPSRAAEQPQVVTVLVRADSEASGYEAHRAFDGNPETMWHTVWGAGETTHPHEILVDLRETRSLTGFTYHARRGAGNGTIKDYEGYVADDAKRLGEPVVRGAFQATDSPQRVEFPTPARGRYLVLRALSEVNGTNWTSIAELDIHSPGVRFAADRSPAALLGVELPKAVVNAAGPATHENLAAERAAQFLILLSDLRTRARFAQVAPETYRAEALILPDDRDPLDVVLRRTNALLDHLRRQDGAADLTAWASELKRIEDAAAGVAVEDVDARYALYEDACRVRRAIALSNPLLNFDRILFIKRHRATFNHMCDQYYGIHANPGGSLDVRPPEQVRQLEERLGDADGSGLFLLENPFGSAPRAVNVLADSVVERGRLAGERLVGGSFLSPDLSYDAQSVLFAYVECRGDRGHDYHTDASRGHWSAGWSYHVFKANLDGAGLEQLTDGTWNDFDPIWLPNGRIAFITERRGGYLRCGRVCPTYTLYDMAADGSDIRPLSVHETNEWHPSVTHDGRIIWTRWDYVDRHGVTAHKPWTLTLDGRDPRPVWGNYTPRNLRPDMVLDVRAIPGSHKLVGTAAPHHGQAFGSLVLIDPHVPDIDGIAPLKRLTPEEGYPETQGGGHSHGNPWPLGEEFYLCVYDPAMRNPNLGFQGRAYVRGDYGIYLVDAFGNKELLYRDASISSMSPIPLHPRPVPPVMPEVAVLGDAPVDRSPGTHQVVRVDGRPAEGSMAVLNIYDSLRPWPEGSKITAIRVLHVLPMSVPSGSPPHEVGVRVAGAGDSVVPARWVLGTAPVEPDGSAYFVVPAHKSMFFQALDERGLAVQSMRSATYVQPGERLVCQGCHEPKHLAAEAHAPVPLALQRQPSRLVPDVDGSHPFSYPRLVQPVLDRHCVGCHEENRDKAPNLGREPIERKWFASYNSLAPKFGYHDYGEPMRTTPGRFGAQASKLYQMLAEGHHDVKLGDEEMHRITLWLDCVSAFYGVFEKEGGEAQLRGEIVLPTLE